MPTPKKYIPIDCHFYDRFEAAIVQRAVVHLEFRTPEGQHKAITTRLSDTLTKEGEEFLILPSGAKIRMDYIISMDGVPVPKSC